MRFMMLGGSIGGICSLHRREELFMGHKLTFVAFAFCLPLATAGDTDYVYVDGFEALVDCSAELSCPVPTTGKACVSGRINDAGSGLPLRALLNAELQCGSGAIGGPCALSVTAHDATAFANNPLGSAPLSSNESLVDGCGRFRFSNLTPPSLEIMGSESGARVG